jgi:general secretion pathway protein G
LVEQFVGEAKILVGAAHSVASIGARNRLSEWTLRLQMVKRIWSAIPWIVIALVVLVLFGSRDSFESTARVRPVAARAQIDQFLVALQGYKADVGDFPTESQGLAALRENPGVRGWNGPYLPREVPTDPWGLPYRYSLNGGQPQIVSLGGGAGAPSR